MITNFTDVKHKARRASRVTIAVAAAQAPHVLSAAHQAWQEGLADSILVGHRSEILATLEQTGIPAAPFEIEDVEGDLAAQSARAVELVASGTAQVLMKGQVDTSILLKAVLADKRLRTGRPMCAVGILEVAHYPKLLMVTDAGILIAPDLEQKREVIINALAVASALEIEQPKVAVLCAKEKVNPKMQDTLDAEALVGMNREGQLTDCLVGGPFALDNAVSPEAAQMKAIEDPVAGDADIILAPDLVSGNSLYKALTFLAGGKSAAIVVGAKIPMIMTSRADSEESRLNSIAIAALMNRPASNS